MTTIPSSLDVGEWPTLSWASWQLAIEDDGSRGPGLLYVTGSADDWSWLSRHEPSQHDLELLAAISQLPLLRVGFVRGTCRGLATALASHLDVLFGVGPGLDVPPDLDLAARLTEDESDSTFVSVVEAVGRSPQAVRLLARVTQLQGHVEGPDALFAETATYSLLLAGSEFSSWLEERSRADGRCHV